MIQIDARIDEATLRQFASQVDTIPPNVRHVIDESFLWEEGPEYYHGQVAALAFCFQLAEGTDKQAVIGSALAVVAAHIIKKGWW